MRHSVDMISYGPEMHHCASLTKSDEGYFLVCYHGQECRDEQRVVIGFAKEPGKILKYVDLVNKTGNPIIWEFKGQVYLMYSLFTDATEDGVEIDYGRALVNRWKNCDNFLAKVSLEDGEIKIEDIGKINGAYGLLARCQPLVEKNRVLIPLYREEDPVCQIWEFKEDQSFKMISEFGYTDDGVNESMKDKMTYGSLGKGVAIQPALIKSKDGYRVFCRNVCRPLDTNDNLLAWTSGSKDCINWSGLKSSGIPNHNNSIAAINSKKGGFIVYSDNRSRNNILLINVSKPGTVPIVLNHYIANKRQSFSYPNIMLANGEMHIVHTNCQVIAWHHFDEEYMENAF